MDMPTCVGFKLSEIFFAIPIRYVKEILPFLPVNSIPDSPSYVHGVSLVRGESLLIVDAAAWLNLKRISPIPLDPTLIVFSAQGRAIGLMVDEVLDLVDLPETGVAPLEEALLRIQFQDRVVERNGAVYRLMNPDQDFPPFSAP